MAFTYCAVFKKDSTILIANVIKVYAPISLIFYSFQLLGGGNLLYSLGRSFMQLMPPVTGVGEMFSNFLIFTYDKQHWFRNSGFAWEPGAYGCFLCIGLLFYWIKNDFKFDKWAYLIIIAIISTVSTTAFIALSALLFIYYRNVDGKINAAVLVILVISIGSFIYLPFLGEKIIEIYEKDVEVLDDYDQIMYDLEYYQEYGGEVKLNRFSSAIFLYQHFEEKLIMGVSNAYVNIKSKIYGVNISMFNISNGVADFIAKFGLIGFVLILYRVGYFSYLYFYRKELSFYVVTLILIINFGEPLFISPITLIFIFLPKFGYLNVSSKNKN